MAGHINEELAKRHAYTPKHMLSPSTICKLVKELTSGRIMSRAGLDNIDVEKGMENFSTMRQITETLAPFARDDSTKEDLLERIDTCETFHKVHFERHLQQDENRHVCMCLHCGFYDEINDPIKCNEDHKSYPCQDCQDSFSIIEDLLLFHEKAKSFIESSTIYESNPEIYDDVLQWENDIETCKLNLIDYRAHLSQKVSEHEFDQKEYLDINENEALVVMDYKMKVLPSSFREKQIDWYSKRGISVLGVEIHVMINGQPEVLYHFFISDDANQNAEAVLCAKHFLYAEVLPRYNVKEVKFRSDGAGCFSSNDAKAALKLWDDLAQAAAKNKEVFSYEKAYKVMVAGCGKTALDGTCIFNKMLQNYKKYHLSHISLINIGMFGILTMHLVRLVNYGHSFQTANDLFDLLQQFTLKRSTFHVFKPQRNLLSWPTINKTTSKLNRLHLLEFDAEKQKAFGKFHSNVSIAIEYRTHKNEGLQIVNTRKRKEKTDDNDDSQGFIDVENGKCHW